MNYADKKRLLYFGILSLSLCMSSHSLLAAGRGLPREPKPSLFSTIQTNTIDESLKHLAELNTNARVTGCLSWLPSLSSGVRLKKSELNESVVQETVNKIDQARGNLNPENEEQWRGFLIKLINSGAPLTITGGRSLLNWALLNHYEDIVRTLAHSQEADKPQFRAELNSICEINPETNKTPLEQAIEAKKFLFAQTVLQIKPLISCDPSTLLSLLNLAILHGSTDLVDDLLHDKRIKANLLLIDTKDSLPAIRHSLEYNHGSMAVFLQTRSGNSFTPDELKLFLGNKLHSLKSSDWDRMSQKELFESAQISVLIDDLEGINFALNRLQNINQKNALDQTLLHLALDQGSIQAINRLLSVNSSLKMKAKGKSPLQIGLATLREFKKQNSVPTHRIKALKWSLIEMVQRGAMLAKNNSNKNKENFDEATQLDTVFIEELGETLVNSLTKSGRLEDAKIALSWLSFDIPEENKSREQALAEIKLVKTQHLERLARLQNWLKSRIRNEIPQDDGIESRAEDIIELTNASLFLKSDPTELRHHPILAGAYEVASGSTSKISASDYEKNPLLRLFDFQKATQGTRVNRAIQAFSNRTADSIREEQEAYLARPEIKQISCDLLLEELNRRILSKEISESEFLDFDSGSLISIPQAKARLKVITGLCRPADHDRTQRGWPHVFAEYTLKRVLKHWQDQANILAEHSEDARLINGEINTILKILVSGGGHCIDGQMAAVYKVSDLFNKARAAEGKPQDLLSKTPEGLRENLNAKLDELREEIFKEVIAFSDNRQTGSTAYTARNLLSQSLLITPTSNVAAYPNHFYRSRWYLASTFNPILEPIVRLLGDSAETSDYHPYYLKGYYLPFVSETRFGSFVKQRFFHGKVGETNAKHRKPAIQAELRRSHAGYTSANIVKTAFLLLQKNPDLIKEAKDLLKQTISDASAEHWKKNNAALYNESFQELPPQDKANEDWNTVHEVPLDLVKESMVRMFYFSKYPNPAQPNSAPLELPNETGLRKLLLLLEHLLEV